jgi:hypothetical protein
MHVVGFAQPEALVRTYGGLHSEECYEVIESMSGNFVILGNTGSIEEGNSDVYVMSVDDNGDCIWSVTIGNSFSQHCVSMTGDAEGNYYLAGFTSDLNGYDVYIVKLDSFGQLLWERTVGGPDWDFGTGIFVSDNRVVVCGSTYSFGNGDSDGYLLELNSDGELIYSYTYGGLAYDSFNDVFINENENVIVGGSSQDESGVILPWIISLDTEYMIQWQKVFDSFDSGEITDIADSDGENFLLCGVYIDAESGNNSGFCQKLNNEATVIWQQQSNEYTVNSIVQGEEWIYIVGNTELFGLGGSSAMILRLDLWGNWQNGAAFGESQDEFGNDVLIDQQGRVLMAGVSNSYSLNDVPDIYLVIFPDNEIVSEYQLDIEHQDCFYVDVKAPRRSKDDYLIYLKDYASFSWSFDTYRLGIYDVSGKLIYENLSYRNGSPVPNISSGVYCVVVVHDNVTSSMVLYSDVR